MFIFYFDKKYYRWASLLIKSIKHWEPDDKILAFCINLEDEQVKEIKSLGAFPYHMPLRPISDHVLPFQIIEHKAWYLLRAFNGWPKEEYYIMMDIDMLVVNSMKYLKNSFINGNFDFAAVLANPDKICGGFYVFRNNKLCKKLLEDWDKYLRDDNYFFDKDQPSLSKFVMKYIYEHGLKVMPVSRKYLDHLSRSESVIWSAHKSEFGDKDKRFDMYRRKVLEQSW